jgi:hypothetical protein
VLYRQSLKDLIRNISKKIDTIDGNRIIAEVPNDIAHLYKIVEEESKGSEGVKDFVEYGRDGVSKNTIV